MVGMFSSPDERREHARYYIPYEDAFFYYNNHTFGNNHKHKIGL